ncbi:V-set and transmembrane domain-containing protein 5 [Bombina bombina]|uniref:V-set and transmembrane domain-containing protein 5 n=1 Tax=Bombina bombina TaxID=8345 RepID=UPI00235A5742|nr:V-set and transmembrane domain-containing protein 5 [Bombina bombina]
MNGIPILMKTFRNWRQSRASTLLFLLCFIRQFCQNKGITLLVPQTIINATVSQDILLSVQYISNGTPTIQWEYMSKWKIQRITEWKNGSYFNVSRDYKDRINRYDNGSILLMDVGVKDTGYYVVIITEDIGSIKHGTIILNVHEILYEDFYFVAVFIAFLAAGSAVLICLMWLCNKCGNVATKRKQSRRAEEVEMRIISDLSSGPSTASTSRYSNDFC